MIKALNTQVVLEGITAKKDKSLSIRFSTPELSSKQKATVMDLQGVLCDLLLQPQDTEFPEIEKVDTDINQKSQAQRLRGVLFVLWKQNNEGLDLFPAYYHKKTEGILEHLKGKISDV